MLRRNSSKVDRRKSTSSTHSKHESIDPEVSRQHAQAAAMLAYTRAQERHSTDMGNRPGGLSRSNTTTSQQNSPQVNGPAPQMIRRQQSVRFVGPTAVQTRQSLGARAINHPAMPRTDPASLRPVAMTTNDPVPAAYRPPSRSSSIGKASIGKRTTDNYVTALAAYNEYYTQEDDVASTPSSYRRLRRSKSMFSPLKAPEVFYTNDSPDRPMSGYRGREHSIATSRTPNEEPTTAALRAPRSMSFLRAGRDHLKAGFRERNDEAVQLARDRFFHQTSQQRLREQPSFLFRSKSQRQDKPFRQSVRTSSANSYGLPIASANQDAPPKESGLKEKARRASKSIKNKLKRAFGRNKVEPVEIPNQQVEAFQTHVRRYPGPLEDIDVDGNFDNFDDVPHPTPTTLKRVASRPPSIHPANSNQQLRSYAGSVKSNKSDQSDDKSRVTSWATTGVPTINSQGTRIPNERDLQRLSVINENGTHVPSSSFHREKITTQFSAYPMIHKPSKIVGHVPAIPPPGPIDSARVYSALMKRLDENSPKAKLEAARKASLESLTLASCVPPRTSSVHDLGNGTPATIRQVPESNYGSQRSLASDHEHKWVKVDSIHSAEAEDVFGFTGTHIHQWTQPDALREARMRDQDDVFYPKYASNNKENIPVGKENMGINFQRARSGSDVTNGASIRTSYHTVPEDFGLTPQEIASRNEPSFRGNRTIRDTKSTFFGGPGITITRTASPFRRALADADYNATALNDGVPISLQDFPFPTPLNVNSKTATSGGAVAQGPVEVDRAYSESVYSRTTSGQGPGAANSTLSLAMGEDEVPEMPFSNSTTGDVVILDRTTYRPAMPGSQGHRNTSSASSNDWKKWMSSEVAKLERARDNTNTGGSYINYALPTMPRAFHVGHVRENAQIDSDDTDISQRKVSAVKQPIGLLQQNTSVQNIQHQHQMSLQNPPVLKPILKNRSVVSLVDNVEASKPLASIPIPPPPPPPIPVRSPLRTVPSKSSLRSVNTVNTMHTVRTQSAPNSASKIPSTNGRNVLHKRNTSQSTLRSVKSFEAPTAKLVKRNSRRPSNAASASPGSALNTGAERLFNSSSTRSRTPGVAWGANRENYSPKIKGDLYGTDGAGLEGPMMSGGAEELDAQQMGSKRMVDMFLSSRRRRIAGGSEESGVFI